MQSINLSRVFYLAKNEIKSKGWLMLMITLIAFGILTFYFFNSGFSLSRIIDQTLGSPNNFNTINLQSRSLTGQKFHFYWFNQSYLILSLVFISLAFAEYSTKQKSALFLTLPAQKIEKWLAKASLYLFILPLGILLLYQGFSLLTYKWDDTVGAEQVRLGITDPYLWKNIMKTLPIQCAVFFGAVYFRKYSFFKIFLTFGLIYFSVNFIQTVSLSVINSDMDLLKNSAIPGLQSPKDLIQASGYKISNTFQDPIELLKDNLNYTYIVLVTIGALILSYFKFTELEA